MHRKFMVPLLAIFAAACLFSLQASAQGKVQLRDPLRIERYLGIQPTDSTRPSMKAIEDAKNLKAEDIQKGFKQPEPARTAFLAAEVNTICNQSASGLARDKAGKIITDAFNRNLRTVVASAPAREDIAHNAMEKVLANCQRLLEAEKPGSYMMTILQNEAVTYHRKSVNDPSYSLNDADTDVTVATPDPSIDLEARNLVEKLQATLTPREWEVLTAYLDNEKTSDIATRLNIRPDSVRSLRDSVRKKVCGMPEAPSHRVCDQLAKATLNLN